MGKFARVGFVPRRFRLILALTVMVCTKIRLEHMSHPELLRLRDSIDNIDAALIHLLAERFKCTQAVGEYKAAHGLPAADPSRETQQIARLRGLAQDAKLDPDFAEKFLNFIVKEVIRHHEAIRQGRI